MTLDTFISRLQELTEEAKTIRTFQGSPYGTYVMDEDLIPYRARGLSVLEQTFGVSHSYYKGFEENTRGTRDTKESAGAVRILEAAMRDLKEGWLIKVRHLVSAEVFADLMEMAEYFLSEGYKDAAAVMIGGVLEEHLRQLCRAKGIDIESSKPDGTTAPKKADRMNADLVKADAYLQLDGKQVTAWLALRNHAAHAEHDKYDANQIQMMYEGVRNFLVRITP